MSVLFSLKLSNNVMQYKNIKLYQWFSIRLPMLHRNATLLHNYLIGKSLLKLHHFTALLKIKTKVDNKTNCTIH